ncbi:kinetochore protein SLK19-like [Myzus persicae]|uniref:kinetochore protein SLK19-like n=1 Tax=Myzus persicae TaxID=13164 RepID=UPI000B93882B|nr:kinetochore protein SLK19-like [Myzus persicae]
MDNYKLRNKQKTLEIDKSVENIQRDDISIENPVEYTSNINTFLDNNKSNDLIAKEQLENVLNQQTNVADPTSHPELLGFENMSSELEENLVDNYYSHALETESETCKNSSDDGISLGFESINTSALKRQLDCSQGLLKELLKYEKEQEITFNDLLLLSLTQEILRLEDRMKQLGEQAETKYNEREFLRQKVMDNSTDLDAINEDNAKITLLWNDVLISIQQRDKCFLKTKNDFQLKREHNNLQNNFKTYLDKFNCLKEEYSKLIQMTEFQHQNLDQVTLINNKISEIKVQNKEHELLLVEVENNLSKELLKLEQCRTTSFNLEQDIVENTKYLNDKGLVLSTLDSELKKLYTEIQNKTKHIDLENKQLEVVKKLHDEGYILTPQMEIDQVRNKIDEVVKETNFIKQSWIQKQNKNVQLLAQLNNQFNELVKVRKYDLVMDTKNKKLEKEIVSLSKEVYQYKQILTNMRNTIVKLNERFSQNKGKSNMLLNENEWIQCSYLAELKENEKLCLEYMDQLKLLKNELNELKNVYMEKQCESKSWDTKLLLLIEIKKEIKNKEGDLGDIDIMKNEIHRMQIRECQLKKILEKIMLDLEVCITKRETIYNKVAAKDIRLKGKNEAKQKFLKQLDYLKTNIKKIKTVTILMYYY